MDNYQLIPRKANALLDEAMVGSIGQNMATNVAARSAEAQVVELNTLRHVANARTASEPHSAEMSRFIFCLLISVVLAMLVFVVMSLATRAPETNTSRVLAQIEQAQQTSAPFPGPRSPQGSAGSLDPHGALGHFGAAEHGSISRPVSH